MILKGKELTDRTGVKTLSKFQLFCSENIVNPEHKEYCLKRMLTFDMAKDLFDYGRSIGQEVFYTVDFPEAVDWCEAIGVNYYKIRFYDRYNFKILDRIEKTKKETFISINNDCLEDCIGYKIEYGFKPLFCVPKYPAKQEDYCGYMGNYQGISDHTPDLCLLKTQLKYPTKCIEYFERHVSLTKEGCLEAQWASTFEELEEVLTK